MIASTRASVVFVALVTAGCRSTSAPAPAPPATSSEMTTAAPAPPAKAGPVLAEPAADQLGTAPAGLGLAVGAQAPDATLLDVTGNQRQLGALYREAPTFVVFYRGGWCPFCNLQLHKLAAAMPDFERQGLRVAAISVDQPGEQAKTQAKNGVPFPMLSDRNLAAHKAFNVVHVPPAAEAEALRNHGVDLEAYAGERHHSFAVPAIFLVDRAGTVRWVHIDEDYKTRPTPTQLLQVAARILGTGPAAR